MTDRRDYWPSEIEALVHQVTYKPHWSVWLGEEFGDDGAGGLKLFIVSTTPDSYDVERIIRVRHEFLVPRASYSRDVWAAWLFDRFCDVETHEAGEFFQIDGLREFAPHHGNGEDPYRVWHVGDYADTRVRAGDWKDPLVTALARAQNVIDVRSRTVLEGGQDDHNRGMQAAVDYLRRVLDEGPGALS